MTTSTTDNILSTLVSIEDQLANMEGVLNFDHSRNMWRFRYPKGVSATERVNELLENKLVELHHMFSTTSKNGTHAFKSRSSLGDMMSVCKSEKDVADVLGEEPTEAFVDENKMFRH